MALYLGVLVTCLWVVWGVPEMFHEGWYAPFEWLFFLLPAGVMMTLTLVGLRWPRTGATLFVVLSLGFGGLILWQFRPGGGRSAGWILTSLLSRMPTTLLLVVIGTLFYRGRAQTRPRTHYLAAIGVPLLLALALAIWPAYRVIHRVDDNYRGERFIQGNGIALHWAPAGPGWDRDGGVAWNEVALYGKGGAGFEGKRFGTDGLCDGSDAWATHCASQEDMLTHNVCLYLDREGTQLMPTRQDIWRMPTTDEVVRSLVRHGDNAGCAWDGTVGRASCEIRPDKETPLWDPQARVVYYWTADEATEGEVYFVVYFGEVVAVPKFMAVGSRGYRCVRE